MRMSAVSIEVAATDNVELHVNNHAWFSLAYGQVHVTGPHKDLTVREQAEALRDWAASLVRAADVAIQDYDLEHEAEARVAA